MGFNSSQGLFLLLTVSLFAVSVAKKAPYRNVAPPAKANVIVVGGSEGWHFGYNYNDWAKRNSPFYLQDTLVFKYDPPNGTNFVHSVYLLRDYWSFMKCDLRGAKVVGNVSQGGGEGFKFVLNKWRPYFFACGEKNGFHCNTGIMKFMVMPLPRCHP